MNYTLCITIFKPSHILLPTLFQPGPLLVEIVLNAYMHICIHIFLNIACWVHLMLPVCMTSGLTFWHWKTNWCYLSWESYLSCAQLSSVAYNSLCRIETSWAFPRTVWHIHWLHSCSAHTLSVMMGRLYGCSFQC